MATVLALGVFTLALFNPKLFGLLILLALLVSILGVLYYLMWTLNPMLTVAMILITVAYAIQKFKEIKNV